MSDRLFDELSDLYTTKIVRDRIKDEKAKSIIEDYAHAIMYQPGLERLMILKLLILSGDDMHVDAKSAAEFQKMYRSWGVIPQNSIGSYDDIMWNLMHMDDIIWEVLGRNGIK